MTNEVSESRPRDTDHAASFDCTSGEVTVKVEGELSIRNADSLRTLLAESLDRSSCLAIDLADVESCDAAGLQLICSLRRTAVERGQRLRFGKISDAFKSASDALGLRTADLLADIEPAAEHFSTAPGERSRGV